MESNNSMEDIFDLYISKKEQQFVEYRLAMTETDVAIFDSLLSLGVRWKNAAVDLRNKNGIKAL